MKANDFAASILADAKKRAAEIERKAKEDVKALKAETERLVSSKRAQLIEEVRREEEQERNRLEAKRHLEGTIMELSEKQRLIDEAFAAAAERLAAMPKGEREKILERLWARATSEIEVGHVEAAAKDAPFFKGRVDAQAIEGIGGFVAHSKDGAVSVDLRFETLLEGVRQQHLREIASALFGGKR